MLNSLLDFLAHGLLHFSWWQLVLYTLIATHITIIGVTVYLHRCQAHRALELHPIVSHFFRFWLWMTTGMVTREWVAIHRKHHAKCETEEDPHSPQTRGLKKVLAEGADRAREIAAGKFLPCCSTAAAMAVAISLVRSTVLPMPWMAAKKLTDSVRGSPGRIWPASRSSSRCRHPMLKSSS